METILVLMRAFRFRHKLLDFFIILPPAVITLWQYIVASADTRLTHETPGLFWQLVDKFRYLFPVMILIVFIVVQFYRLVSENEYKKTLTNIVERIHHNYFPYSTGGCDPNYRVSLFVPLVFKRIWKLPFFWGKEYLKLYVRSGTPKKSRLRWCITDSENSNYDGVVGYGWATGIFVAIDQLPEYKESDDNNNNDYLKKTYITKEKATRLNVRSRSYRCLVIKSKSGDKIGVLMMESVDPNGLLNIKPQKLWQEAEYLQCLFI